MSFWCVVQCESRVLAQQARDKESLAEHLLRGRGFECYLPRTRAAGSARILPLFPTYIFVRIIDRWYSARWSPGVVRVLMSGDAPAPLPDHIVGELRRSEVHGLIRLPPPPGALTHGKRVRVKTGSSCGHIGLYEGQSSRQRERILLNLFGRMTLVELVPTDRIEAVNG